MSAAQIFCCLRAAVRPHVISLAMQELMSSDYRLISMICVLISAVIDHMQPSGHMWTSLACAWSKIGDAGEVRAVMADMRNAGLVPDAYLWNSLIHAHAMSFQPGRCALLSAVNMHQTVCDLWKGSSQTAFLINQV